MGRASRYESNLLEVIAQLERLRASGATHPHLDVESWLADSRRALERFRADPGSCNWRTRW